MDELISKKKALDAIDGIRLKNGLYSKERLRATGDARNAIQALPSVWKRKTGIWKKHPNASFHEWDVCSVCGVGCKRREYGRNPDGTVYIDEYSYSYCPNCGAEMKQITSDDILHEIKNEKQAFISDIVNCFENFLECKGITIENSEKEDSIYNGEDCASNIYGTDYGVLQSDIEEILSAWNLA